MCRFVMYKGEPLALDMLVLKPKNSLVNQSMHSHMGSTRLNGDGFGVAWYAPHISPEPGLFRCVSPAWNDANLNSLARFVRSPCILAHVRAASVGLNVGFTNCHPFTSGTFAFMHNGDLGGFAQIRRRLLGSLSDASFQQIGGTTDSEHIFAVFQDRLRESPAGSPREAMTTALLRTVSDLQAWKKEAGVREASYLNVVVSDGNEAVALRYTSGTQAKALSLYYHSGERYVCEDGECHMLRPDEVLGALLISSEPLSDDPGWDPVPPNHILLVAPDGSVEVRPVTLPD